MTRVLVLNCGSSSVRYRLYDGSEVLAKGLIQRIGESGGDAADHDEALRTLMDRLDLSGLAAVGHRVVHGGERFTASTVITDEVVAAVEELVPLAPLHNPGALTGIRVAVPADDHRLHRRPRAALAVWCRLHPHAQPIQSEVTTDILLTRG